MSFDPRRTYDTGDRLYDNDGLYDGWSYRGENTTDWIVELGFDLSANGIGDWFTLDDPTKGELDNVTYLLTGDVFVDLTRYVRSIDVDRGRSRELEKFTAGRCDIVFDNRDRLFDPLIENAPFSGQIVPRKPVRVTYLGERVFTGNVDDWDFDYTDFDATATVKAVDGFQYLASRNVPEQTMTLEALSDRVDYVLSAVGWPDDLRDIDLASASAGADVVGAGTNALAYLQSLELSQNGLFFVNKEGVVRFESSYYGTLHPAEIGDDGVRFVSVDVSYGTEELLNRFNVGYLSGSATQTVTVNDTTSQDDYGIFETDITTLLSASAAAQALGESLVFRYGKPQYRIDEVQFNVRGASTFDRSRLLDLDLGDRVRFKWRPNGVGAAVNRSVLVDGISHSVAPGRHMMSLQLTDLGYSGEQELLVGGQVSEYKDGPVVYRLHSFTEPGVYDLEIVAPVSAEALVVAAGGGIDVAGSGAPGGGGAGGVLYGPVTFSSASTIQVVVGEFTQGASGQSSQLGNVFVADGGGLGGAAGSVGGAGGSGGGGGSASPSFGAGGTSTQATIGTLIGYGNVGGTAGDDGKGTAFSGGGGGAGGAGGLNTGGAPLSASITGVSASYAAGGVGEREGAIGSPTGITPTYGDGYPGAVSQVFWLEPAHGVVYVRYQL